MDKKQRAIVVGVHLKGKDEDFSHSMEELKGLAEACHLEVIGELTQNAEKLHKSHYFGKGKLSELVDLVMEEQADFVVFNDELSPSQIRVLEEELDGKVIDRTMLILDIFAERAKTREAKLQVEVANLQYMLPRLIGAREDLGRQGGGAGLKNRGAGETKLELDRRKIEEKIAALMKELKKLEEQRQVRRNKRRKSELPVISLVGYTNAGKSSIMNAMLELYHPSTDKQVFEKDMLFATLETSVRHIKLEDNKEFLLTDTVGFVNKLPHHLVKAFRSTLEEAAEADLLIHVVDCSDPAHEKLIEVTNRTLKEIGVRDIPMIYAFNKTDLIEEHVPRKLKDAVYLSAKHKTGLDELLHMIRSKIFWEYMKCEMLIPYNQGQCVSYFNEHGHVLETNYEENGIYLKVECRQSDIEKYKQYVIKSKQ